MVQKRELIYSGKAKSLYATDDQQLLIVEFRDDTTAFDGVKQAKLESKGHVNNSINAFIMQYLVKHNVTTHFHSQLSATESCVTHLTMIPIENVVRNIAAGSLCRRLGVTSGKALMPPLHEIFLKNDELHDPFINDNHAVLFGWADEFQLQAMRSLSLQINELLTKLFANAGLILVDAKFEFGIDSNGVVCLGDEISPDSCRIWDMKTRKVLDKDRFRQDMGEVISSYQEIAQRLGIQLNK